MARELTTKTILDDDGNAIEYTLIPHAASEGIRLATRLFAVAGGAVGKLIESAARGKGGIAAATRGELADLDVDVGAAAADLAQGLMSVGADDLCRQLLRHATRGGKPLDNPAVFDSVYQSNYGELAEALAWVIAVNGFLRFFARFASQAVALAGRS